MLITVLCASVRNSKNITGQSLCGEILDLLVPIIQFLTSSISHVTVSSQQVL